MTARLRNKDYAVSWWFLPVRRRAGVQIYIPTPYNQILGALPHSLNERIGADGIAFWEEGGYCSPPLAEEGAGVLDEYFDAIAVKRVARDGGRLRGMPWLIPVTQVGG